MFNTYCNVIFYMFFDYDNIRKIKVIINVTCTTLFCFISRPILRVNNSFHCNIFGKLLLKNWMTFILLVESIFKQTLIHLQSKEKNAS